MRDLKVLDKMRNLTMKLLDNRNKKDKEDLRKINKKFSLAMNLLQSHLKDSLFLQNQKTIVKP